MKDFFFLILGLIIVFGSVFLFLGRTSVTRNETKIIKINDTSIKVEIVDTPETREQGLSDRETLSEGAGMLFIFDSPANYGFWMKDMKFAIDIVWIDEKSHVIGIEREVLPGTFPQTFYPNQPVKYVLELPAGSTNRYNINIGAVVQL
ncbi:MAG: DUF192 domain-containing protein [bacterium]|nr:DUF192 domain-containing protein [bacterium]